jgi:aspartyl-tRNA(Asn)/glutamyl-tRNA(Gln) amidotransferase subunit B
VESAIDYEVKRQIALLEAGEAVSQETRGWDEVKLKTYTQRTKETAKDYRYFPDPDLPKIDTSKHSYFSESRLSEMLPELPDEIRLNYANIGIPSSQIEQMIATKAIGTFFSSLVKLPTLSANVEALRLSANYLTSDVLAELGKGRGVTLSPENFSKLMLMLLEAKVNSRVAKDLLIELLDKDADPTVLAKERGLLQSSDPSALTPVIDAVIAEFQSAVAEYYAGKEAAIQFLVGQCMKQTRGTANPSLLAELLKTRLEETR